MHHSKPLVRPDYLFDREFEWAELERFVSYPGTGPALGVVSGRRRQGKTFLLDAVCQVTGGFYFAATEATPKESLRQLGSALARHARQPAPYRFAQWEDAVEVLMTLPGIDDAPLPVVLDEFPFLAKASPELPSLLQRALGPAQRREGRRTRLLLCGSALSFMRDLLAGGAPLRGRASLELVVPTLDYRLAAEFWGITDPRLAVLMNAVVGGTPAYAREFSLGDTPADAADFGPWVLRNVFNPGRPLFREARLLLAEEPAIHDTALYQGVLSAVATGNHTRGGIANYLGRKSTDLGHPLTVLEDIGLLIREPDAFHRKRSAYRIAEPILSFYHAVMRPEWSDLERPGRAAQVWERVQPTFLSQVVGPHFERLCRYWTRWHAAPESLGGTSAEIGTGTIADPAARVSVEIDVVVTGRRDDAHNVVLAIGEAKWSETVGLPHLERLQRAAALVAAHHDVAPSGPRLLLFGGAGFSAELRRTADLDQAIQLVDLDRLYHGS